MFRPCLCNGSVSTAHCSDLPHPAQYRKMPWHVDATLYSEALLLLGGAVVAAPIFKSLGLGTVLGYLAAGVVIGPSAR